MSCKSCNSKRIATVNGKTSDMCSVRVGNKEHNGYVPDDMGIGGSDYIDFKYCLDCGKINGNFPMPVTKLETGE